MNGVTGARSRRMVVWAALLGSAATALATASVARAATGDVWTYGTAGNGDTGAMPAPDTNPSIAGLTGGGYEIAYQATDGQATVTGDQTQGTLGFTIATGSSPAITGLTNGGYEVALMDSANDLLSMTGAAGTTQAPIGMEPGSSPSIAAVSGGGYEATVQANNNEIYAWGSLGQEPTPITVAPTTSPAIAVDGNNEEIAYQAPDSGLSTMSLGDSAGDDTHEGMWQASSPAIATLANGSYYIAFVINQAQVYAQEGSATIPLGFPVQEGTNPSVAGLSGGDAEIAYHGANGDLWLWNSATGTVDTGQAMAAGTSPSIAALANGGYEAAYIAPAPPSTPTTTTTVTPTTPAAHAGSHRIRTTIRLGWRWSGRRSRIISVYVARVPRRGTVTVRCLGATGCGRPRSVSERDGHIQTLINALIGRVYRSGDRLEIRVTAPGDPTVSSLLEIRDGRAPRIVAPRVHRRADHRRKGHHG